MLKVLRLPLGPIGSPSYAMLLQLLQVARQCGFVINVRVGNEAFARMLYFGHADGEPAAHVSTIDNMQQDRVSRQQQDSEWRDMFNSFRAEGVAAGRDSSSSSRNARRLQLTGPPLVSYKPCMPSAPRPVPGPEGS